MKFRKGNSVEVLRREHDPCGSWFPGTVVSVDGNDYVIRYKFLLDDEGEPVLEMVCGVDIRPPPLPETGKRWRVGEIVEAFDTRCWRVGKIAKVLQQNRFVIRLFGSIQLKEFQKSDIRIRKSWHNNQWWVTGKFARDRQCTAEKGSKYSLDFSLRAPSLKMSEDLLLGENRRQGFREDGCDGFKMQVRVGTMKRCHADNYETDCRDMCTTGSHKKRKLGPWLGGRSRPQTVNSISFRQIADDSSSRVRMDEKFMGGSTEIENKMVKAASDRLRVSYAPLLSSEDSSQCSVASCSSNEFARENVPKSVENTSNDSDAESSSFPSLSSSKIYEFPSPRHKVEVDIHELELHAYESTVQALYVSGPLSWEQESLLTNLRLSLNISDEEHLLQLRHLLSAQVV